MLSMRGGLSINLKRSLSGELCSAADDDGSGAEAMICGKGGRLLLLLLVVPKADAAQVLSDSSEANCVSSSASDCFNDASLCSVMPASRIALRSPKNNSPLSR